MNVLNPTGADWQNRPSQTKYSPPPDADDLHQAEDPDLAGSPTKSVLSDNQKSVNDFKSGKENALMFLVGKVMSKTKGRASPKKVNEILRKRLRGGHE